VDSGDRETSQRVNGWYLALGLFMLIGLPAVAVVLVQLSIWWHR
jgi:hypothetical protein